jgi:hypothetical protein
LSLPLVSAPSSLCLLVYAPSSLPPRVWVVISASSSLPSHLCLLVSGFSSLASRLCLLVSAFSSLRSSSLSPRLCPFTSVSSPLPPCLYLTSTSRLCPLAIASLSPRLGLLVSASFRLLSFRRCAAIVTLLADYGSNNALTQVMGRDKPRPLVSAAACLGPWYVLVLVSPTLAGISRRGPLRALRHDMRSD